MFVTFEGIDGSGKTTQVDLLCRELRARGHEVVSTREPGGTALGEGIRSLVLHGVDMSPWAEALLYAAARAELVAEVIRPALERGAAVVCDRYVDSSLAYQGSARGLGVDAVLELNLHAVGGLLPDHTFVLAVPPGTAAARATGEPDRIEREGAGFMEQVGAAYSELGERFPERITVLDGTATPETLAEEIREQLALS